MNFSVAFLRQFSSQINIVPIGCWTNDMHTIGKLGSLEHGMIRGRIYYKYEVTLAYDFKKSVQHNNILNPPVRLHSLTSFKKYRDSWLPVCSIWFPACFIVFFAYYMRRYQRCIQALIIFAKSSILDVWLGSECESVYDINLFK